MQILFLWVYIGVLSSRDVCRRTSTSSEILNAGKEKRASPQFGWHFVLCRTPLVFRILFRFKKLSYYWGKMAAYGEVKASKGLVCVTGAGGYVASYLVKRLLEEGYRVRGTVRDPANKVKTDHLRDLPGAQERLELVGADLVVEGSFDAAVEGCEGVFHTASPVGFPKVDPYVEMVEPAIRGTVNVLKSCTKAGVKKVVLTSSSASLRMRPDYSPDVPLDESSWSSVQFCNDIKLWYAVAKTMAEQAAWEYAKESGLNLVSVLPTYIIGQIIPAEISFTSKDVLGLFTGKAGNFANYGRMGYVHIDDVATAHILVYEHPEGEGRYIVSGVTLENYEMAEMVAKRYPQYDVPKIEPGAGMPYYNINVSKLAKLGLDKYKSIEEAFDEVVESYKQKGML